MNEMLKTNRYLHINTDIPEKYEILAIEILMVRSVTVIHIWKLLGMKLK
jgi:hypothetical protein